MSDPLDVPFLTKDKLRRRAESFLDRTHSSREIPVPIELIVDHVLHINIVPVPDLQRNFDLVGCTSADGSCIYVPVRGGMPREPLQIHACP